MEKPIRPHVARAMAEIRSSPALQPMHDPPMRVVQSVQFGILGPDEIAALSVAKISATNTNSENGTVYDTRMGPSNSRGICTTCNEDLRKCPGHFGHIELAIPIINPSFTKFLVLILNCVCLKCSNLKMTPEEINLEMNLESDARFIRYIDRLQLIVSKCSSVKYCNNCNFPHPEIKDHDGTIVKVYDNPGDKKTAKKHSPIEIEELRTILTKITNADLEIMGFYPSKRTIYRLGKIKEDIPTFRPEWLIITNLPVISPIARPPDNEGDNRSDDDLTTSYIDIIKYNERLRTINLKEINVTNTLQLLQKHIAGLFDNTNGSITRSNGKVAKGIKERISGKGGHIRGKLMGKRVDCSARTVITAGPELRLNEVGVPEEIATAMSFPEKVCTRNIHELTALLVADKINTIVRGSKLIHVQWAKQIGRELKLRYGDIAYRQLRDGDTVVFNRQPTLHRGGMMAHYIRVLPGKTFRLNLSVTKPYNAD